MKKYILLLLICCSLFKCSTALASGTVDIPSLKTVPRTIEANLIRSGDNFEVKNIEVRVADYKVFNDFKLFNNRTANGTIFSFKGQNLGYFPIANNLSISICEDFRNKQTGKMSGGCSESTNGNLFIQLPYFPNGKYADIYDPSGKKVLTIDLSSKATCNENGQCNRPVEDSENCPQDCKRNEPKIDPAVVQLAANNQVTAQEAEKKISISDLGWWGIAVLIILLAGGGIGYYVYRKNRS